MSCCFCFFAVLTDTPQSLSAVPVSDGHHQGQEVDLTKPPDGLLQQTAAAWAATPPARQTAVTQKPFRSGLPALQLVLTAALQSQR